MKLIALADLLTDPVRLPLLLAAVTIVARVLYALVSRIVQPFPRVRAAVEALAAATPDVLRAGLQVVAIITGKPAPKLDAVPAAEAGPYRSSGAPGDLRAELDMERSNHRSARATIGELLSQLSDAQRERDALARRVAELTAGDDADEPGKLRPTVVPGEVSPASPVETGRYRVRPPPAEDPPVSPDEGTSRRPPGTRGAV